MARTLQPRSKRHQKITLSAFEQGLARKSSVITVDNTLLAVPASVKREHLIDTEGTAPAHPATREAATPESFLTTGLLAGKAGAVFEVEQTRPQALQALQGRIEKSGGTRIEGWAWDPRSPDQRIRLEVVEGYDRLCIFVADMYRSDLVQLGCGDGRHGFRIELEERLLSEGSHVLTLRCADTGAIMPGSPIVAERRERVAASYPATVTSEVGQVIRGQIDKVTDKGIFGWVMMPDRPLHRCTVLLKEGERTLTQTIASQFRMDLLSAGVGDGCYSFAFEPPSDLADGQDHILDIVEADTGAKLNKAPVRWLYELDSTRAENGLPSDTQDDRLSSTVRELDTGAHVRHAISRGDYMRCRQMGHFATAAATASVLSVADSVRKTGTVASRFLTDSMIAAWLLRGDLQRRFQRLDEEGCQYAFLAWFLCVRPIEEGLVLSCEPTGPILTAMAKVIIAGDALESECTALVLAAYCYVAGYQGSGIVAPLQCPTKDIVSWFICHGAYHLQVSHAIPQQFRADLAAPRTYGVSPLLEWAAQRMPAFNLADLALEHGSERLLARVNAADNGPAASNWRDLLRESLIIDDAAQFDGPPRPVLPSVCGRLRSVVPNMADLLLIDGEPEYMCAGGNGDRLLVQCEWYPCEPTFVWSRTPISTVLFCIDGGAVEWLRIGLIFDQSPLPERQLKVILNHNDLWSGTIGDASSGELILACSGRCIAHDAPNLLQIQVDTAFVPAEQMLSSDHRRLGIGLKRIWIQRGKGLYQ